MHTYIHAYLRDAGFQARIWQECGFPPLFSFLRLSWQLRDVAWMVAVMVMGATAVLSEMKVIIEC